MYINHCSESNDFVNHTMELRIRIGDIKRENAEKISKEFKQFCNDIQNLRKSYPNVNKFEEYVIKDK